MSGKWLNIKYLDAARTSSCVVPQKTREKKMAQVAVLMGSSSDLPKIQSCMDTLKKLGVSFEVRVMSAHRTPDVVKEYVGGAAAK